MNKTIVLSLFFISILAPELAWSEGKTLQEKLSKGTMTITADIKGCDEDAKKYCKGLDPKSEKAFLCMMAYEDMLSEQCKLGITEAAMALQIGKAALDYSISACEADADKHCLNIQPGEGRIIKCLRKNESKIKKECTTALKETGFWDMVK
ncbi:MAG: cysteine rich repeat-containing protein [Thiohalomonadales bacterium]